VRDKLHSDEYFLLEKEQREKRSFYAQLDLGSETHEAHQLPVAV